MIEWHKANKELPLYEMPVLVASKCGEEYPEDIMFVMKMIAWNDDGNDCNMWKCAYDGTVSPIYDDDQWTLINQPKIGKDYVFHIGNKVKIKDGNFKLFEHGEIVAITKPNKITDEVPEVRQYMVKGDNDVIYENILGGCLELCKDGD